MDFYGILMDFNGTLMEHNGIWSPWICWIDLLFFEIHYWGAKFRGTRGKKKKNIRKQSEIKVLGLCAWIGSTPSVQNQEIYDWKWPCCIRRNCCLCLKMLPMTQKLSKMHLVSSESFDFFPLFGFFNSMRHIFISKNGPVAYVEIARFAANGKKCIIFVDC